MSDSRVQTDWNQYYQRPGFFLSRLTRRYLTQKIRTILDRNLEPKAKAQIVELGGGNSILFSVFENFQPKEYLNIDTSETGLALFKQFTQKFSWVRTRMEDVMQIQPEPKADLVISIGLIEHFSGDDVTKIVRNHFALVRPGGLVVMTFPTPTWLYRLSRKISEATGQWAFPDETPLKIERVASVIREHGQILSTEILWPQILTQAIIVVRAKAALIESDHKE